MERNTLLAVALSALVLFSYQAIFVAPKQAGLLKNPQSIAAQNVSAINSPSAPLSSNSSVQSTSTIEKTEDYNMKTKNTGFSYTNVGGSLHKIDFFGNNPFPITDVLSINGLENVQYTGQKLENGTVSLTYRNENWQIIKTFEVKDNTLIKVRMEIKNISSIPILANFNFTAFEIDDSRMEINQNNRENGLYEYSIYSNGKIFRKDNASKFNDKNYKNESAVVNWVGFRDHYHAFIVKPEFKTKNYEIKADSDKQLNISIKPQDQNLIPGKSATYDFSIYVGPQNPWMMKKYGYGFEKIIVFSKYAIYRWPAQAIYYAIPFLHRIFKSWGITIILMGIIFYSLTYPLTMQTMMSMRKMQEMQPAIAAIKEKYKNDPQKLNTETAELFRRKGYNPFGGCLPMIIQMPFFYALYQVMYRAQYFQGQGFLWIKDLSQPDRLMILPFSLPFLGNEINILPILTGIIMFVQQKISSKNMVAADEQQAMQQKMMMYMMPALMGFMFYRFSSAWGLYFATYYSLSTVTQWKIAQTTGKK